MLPLKLRMEESKITLGPIVTKAFKGEKRVVFLLRSYRDKTSSKVGIASIAPIFSQIIAPTLLLN